MKHITHIWKRYDFFEGGEVVDCLVRNLNPLCIV